MNTITSDTTEYIRVGDMVYHYLDSSRVCRMKVIAIDHNILTCTWSDLYKKYDGRYDVNDLRK